MSELLQSTPTEILNVNDTNYIYQEDDISNISRDIISDKDFIMLFITNKREGSEHTARSYTYEIGSFLEYINFPYISLNNVTAKKCVEYRKALKDKGYADATILRKLNIISSLYKYGMDIGYLKFNPMKAVKKPKVEITSQKRFLIPKEVDDLLRELRKKPKHYLIGILLITLGLRASELSNIKWKNFYEDSNGNIGLNILGKGSKERAVKIRRDVWSYIMQYRLSLGLSVQFNPSDESYLIATRNNKQTLPRYIRKLIKQAGQRAGLTKNISTHWLRHTSASLSISGGADIKKCMEQYGWSQMKTAQRYVHSVHGLEDTAVDYINVKL